MKEILIRTVSGLLYVALLIISIYNSFILSVTLLVFGLICITELKKLLNIKSIAIVYGVFFALYSSYVFLQIESTTFWLQPVVIVLSLISIVINLVLIKNLYAANKSSYNVLNKIVLVTFYCSLSFVFIFAIPYFNKIYHPELLLGCFIITWVNDTFAYLVGRLIGKRKFFESVSPKKTIEGFIGGVVFAILSSYLLSTFFTVLSFKYWAIIALLISVLGSFGDLVESKMKRQAHVKDSGSIMPGHGGLLDRLDSVIFSAPFIFLFLILVQEIV